MVSMRYVPKKYRRKVCSMTLSRNIKKGTSRQVINEIIKILVQDEELLRLLWYPSEDVSKGIPHPMERTENIVVDSKNVKEEDKDETYWEAYDRYWDIVNKTVVNGAKAGEIEKESICRIYVYLGRRRPVFNNYLVAKQEVNIDVYVHEDYRDDYRMEWINDRVNALLALESVQGSIGELEYAAGNPRVAPLGYEKFENIFVFHGGKK